MFSQDNGRPLDASKAEKIYLQLGSRTYAMDQDIWFKAIVTNDENHIPTELSGVLYVDLIGPNERIMAHKLVKLAHGIGHGSFELPEDALPGRYLVRAYTQWNLNFGSEFMFRAYIDLYTALNDRNKSPIEGLVLVERKLDNNGYGLRHTETIVLNDTATDLQFFPESGSMVHGFRNKIGFKAMGMDGRGKEVQGTVFGAKGDTAAHFKSNRLGMGIFFLEADSTTTYYAKLLPRDNIDSLVTYPLPKVVPKGSILSVTKTRDKIRLRITSNSLTGRVFVKASCRGVGHYLIEGRLRDGQLVYELPAEQLPEGIIVFTLMDEQHIPVAERLYFNESARDRLDITLAMDKDQYGRRAESGLDIQVLGNGTSLPMVDFSVMVINKNHWGQGTETIRSYFLLSSELRGEVEDPGHYFREENSDRSNDLDALLLTQGWRNYKYPVKRQGNTFFCPNGGLPLRAGWRLNSLKKGLPKELVLHWPPLVLYPRSTPRQPIAWEGFLFFLTMLMGNGCGYCSQPQKEKEKGRT